MTTVELTYPPSANHQYERRGKMLALRDVVKDWRRSAGWAYKAAGGKLLEGAVAVEIELYRPANGSRYDTDNALKCTLDALRGIAYRDDDQVALIVAAKLWPDGQGRMVLRVKKIARG